MSKKVDLVISVDKSLKKETEQIFESLGLDLPTAINIFLEKAEQRDGFPFKVEQEKPDLETLRAMFEAEEMGLEDGPALQDLDIELALEVLKR